MTTGTGDQTGSGASGAPDGGQTLASAWQEVRAQSEIQFAPIELPPEPSQPEWLRAFFAWLERVLEPIGNFLSAAGQLIGVSGQFLTWLLVAAAVLLALYLLWRIVGPRLRRPPAPSAAPEPWAPAAAEALALLDDADRLAAEGRYGEAAHLLLRRSVGQIAAARPGWLEPSTTAREIAALPALSQPARAAFRTIAERVERSLFALRALSADDWLAARDAYADFALAAPQPAAA